jgi:type II secretory pathway pseudopilin PulG
VKPVSRAIARRVRGFTLTELAIAFLVISLLLGGMLMTLSAQNEGRQLAETQRTLDNAREALIGFAVRFGRLPCPAPDGATGDEARRDAANAFTCSVCAVGDAHCEGMLPALTLGIGPTDRQGYLVDAWGNRVRYAVTNWVANAPVDVANCPPNGAKDYKKCPAFTTANAIASLGFANQPPFTYPSMLRVCDVAACSGVNFFAPAVVWSTGRNFLERVGPPLTFGADEAENVDAFIPAVVASDGIFVTHELRPSGGAGGEFDDLVSWLSPSVLYSRLVSAGAL